MTLPKAATIAIILGSFHLTAAAGDQATAVSKVKTQTLSIHPELPPFTYWIVCDRTLGGYGGEVRIDIRGGPKDYIPQTLTPWVILSDVIEALDLNFDGYKDIRILCDRGNRGDEIHECWLYDSPRRQFVPAPDFSMIDEVDHKRSFAEPTCCFAALSCGGCELPQIVLAHRSRNV